MSIALTPIWEFYRTTFLPFLWVRSSRSLRSYPYSWETYFGIGGIFLGLRILAMTA